jgi:hypothetical protein
LLLNYHLGRHVGVAQHASATNRRNDGDGDTVPWSYSAGGSFHHQHQLMLLQQHENPLFTSSSLPDQVRKKDEYSAMTAFDLPSQLSSFTLKKLSCCSTSTTSRAADDERSSTNQKGNTKDAPHPLTGTPTKIRSDNILTKPPDVVMERFSNAQHGQWQIRFQDLLSFHEEYGNCCVPTHWP